MSAAYPVILNGRLVPASRARISVFDRGYLYGDGLFETVFLHRGQPAFWAQHLARLEAGAQTLAIPLPFTRAQLDRCLKRLALHLPDSAVLRLAVSRGCGTRGYSPAGCRQPTWVMSAHPAPHIVPGQPPAWRVMTSSLRLPQGSRLSASKTANRLPHILARAEAETQGAHEALLLNERGLVTEASSANLFWLKGMVLGTPSLETGALPGITRQVVGELAPKLGLRLHCAAILPGKLLMMDGLFLTQSVHGVIAVASVDGQPIPADPRVQALHEAYWQKALEDGKQRPTSSDARVKA